MTLIELTIVLIVLGVLVALAAPPIRRGLDRIAVLSARDALVAAVARTRVAAVAHGGARLVLDIPGAAARVEAAGGDLVAPAIELGRRFDVTVTVDDGSSDRFELRFDGFGLGRSLGGTVRLRRARAEAGITVSSYGRVRPW